MDEEYSPLLDPEKLRIQRTLHNLGLGGYRTPTGTPFLMSLTDDQGEEQAAPKDLEEPEAPTDETVKEEGKGGTKFDGVGFAAGVGSLVSGLAMGESQGTFTEKAQHKAKKSMAVAGGTGAAIGSMFGPVGSAVGGAIGTGAGALFSMHDVRYARFLERHKQQKQETLRNLYEESLHADRIRSAQSATQQYLNNRYLNNIPSL